jgi:hypothetical protein
LREGNGMGITKTICTEIENRLKTIPVKWDGKDAILEMKNNDYPHWKQMEWIGFYFQYLCEKKLADIFQFQIPRYGNASFDGLYQIPFDFKSHAINTSSHTVIVNDSEAISQAIKEYGCVGVIIALGEVVYNDKERTFQAWHELLKGGLSQYTKDRIARGAWSRLRKCSLHLSQITIIEITDKTLIKCGSFQEDFRNSDGSPRRPKLTLNLEKMNDEIVHCIEFS